MAIGETYIWSMECAISCRQEGQVQVGIVLANIEILEVLKEVLKRFRSNRLLVRGYSEGQ